MTLFGVAATRVRGPKAHERVGWQVVIGLSFALAACGGEDDDQEHDSAASAFDAGLDAGADAAPSSSLRDAGLDAAGPASNAPRDAASDAGPRDGSIPKLSEIVTTVFTNGCVLGRCHTTQSPQGDLSLTGRRVSVYDTLVNAPSRAVPDRKLVVPFDPKASYLMEKLESEMPAVGTNMPPGSPLPREQIELVRAWILAGAPND